MALVNVTDSSTIVTEMSTTRRKPERDAGQILFGRTRRQVLSWLFGHPDERFFLRQLAREARVAPGALQRELRALTTAQLVTRHAEGRQVYFQANRASPIFPELQSLLAKTVGVVGLLQRALAPLATRIRAAWIFGSAAKGTVRNESDVDLFVVGEASFAEVVDLVSEVQRTIGRDVNPVVHSLEEFQRKVRTRHHFVLSVLKAPKVFVIGDEDGLVRLEEERMAEAARGQRRRNRRPARTRRP